MTTAELIKKLQEADPEGGVQVVVGNLPIYTVENLPAYYDGDLHALKQDHSKDPYFNIVGYKITRTGRKVKLSTYDLEDWLTDHPEGEVDLGELLGLQLSSWERRVEGARVEAREANDL